jgi:hypothetical protein
MRIFFIILFVFFSKNLISQEYGLKLGVTTATPTGNNDAYDFDFLNSFSLSYQAGLFFIFDFSDIVILKPQLLYREYAIKQEIEYEIFTYDVEQKHSTFSGDLNFNIELTSSCSLIFGMGLDYIIGINTFITIDQQEDQVKLDLSNRSSEQRMDPFANIGLCFKIGRLFLLDIEYRHLLDNWGTANIFTENQLVNSYNGSVKLHMINFSTAILF